MYPLKTAGGGGGGGGVTRVAFVLPPTSETREEKG